MRTIVIALLWLLQPYVTAAQVSPVKINAHAQGMRMQVGGNDFFIYGMNWDYFPIGTNYDFILWQQPEAFIKKALDDEMQLLKKMGVNTLRIYTGIPPKWITYIYQTYGIYTMLNHSFGRYGLMLEGNWVSPTNYADARVRQLLLQEVTEMAATYKNTPGLLFFLLGNENNYGLFWEGAETEDIPVADPNATRAAEHLYQLLNEAALQMKQVNNNHPVAICNGDLLFLDLIARHCNDVDILGINIYRGLSFIDTYQRVLKEYGKPVVLTEFGSDAFNELTQTEDQAAQAKYLLANWQEIFANAAGMGNAGNSLGGFTFQFSDGWWKSGQTYNLDVHDKTASWANGGYRFDYAAGKNNMNEEWFGICAKGTSTPQGHYPLYPRAAYYVLAEVHRFNPYKAKPATLEPFFKSISIEKAMQKAGAKNLPGNSKSAVKIP